MANNDPTSEPEGIFDKIYATNAWKGSESLSGPSSSMARTQNLREALPSLVAKYSVKTLLDAPCGDFYWMKSLIPHLGCAYVGSDIASTVIANNKKNYEQDGVRFLHLDITTDNLPQADMMLCRDCLFHLSYKDTAAFFDNFLRSGIPYIMTTSHIRPDEFENRDINTGEWRWFDLLKPPFSLSQTYEAAVLDGGGDRFMYLWNRGDVAASIAPFVLEHR